jgi:hypothetical protein
LEDDMNGGRRESRLWTRDRVVVGALVVMMVAGGLTTASAAGSSLPILSSGGVRFRIVGDVAANANPDAFTPVSFVVPNHRAVNLTDVVVQNPHADLGGLRVLVGDEIILEETLGGLRDQQYAIPLHVNADQPVVVAVSCQVPGPPQPAAGRCKPSVSFFG